MHCGGYVDDNYDDDDDDNDDHDDNDDNVQCPFCLSQWDSSTYTFPELKYGF